MSLTVHVNIPNLINYLILGIKPVGEDPKEVGGDSRLLWFESDHPFHNCFIAHDRAYTAQSDSRQEGWSRWQVDKLFLDRMLAIAEAKEDPELTKQACIIYLYVRAHGESWWND